MALALVLELEPRLLLLHLASVSVSVCFQASTALSDWLCSNASCCDERYQEAERAGGERERQRRR